MSDKKPFIAGSARANKMERISNEILEVIEKEGLDPEDATHVLLGTTFRMLMHLYRPKSKKEFKDRYWKILSDWTDNAVDMAH